MDDVLISDAIERMLNGEMSQQELRYFEEMRKKDAELDQTVVEHLFFMNQLDAYRQHKAFKHTMSDVQQKLVEEGTIEATKPATKTAKVVKLWQKYRRTITVAASIAGLVSLLIGGIVSQVNKSDKTNLTPLVKKINEQDAKTRQIENKLNALQAATLTEGTTAAPNKFIDSKFRATGFLIDVNNNYLVTNTHVVDQATNALIIENNKGEQFAARTVYINKSADLAIIQVTDEKFKKMNTLPFKVRKTAAELGEEIFLLGYPKPEIVYNEGYISAQNGFNMDTIYCQLSTSANEGSSGSPVLNKNGDLVGIISSKETNAQGVVFAVKSENIYRAIEEVKKLDGHHDIKITGVGDIKNLNRVDQIKKLKEYVFMIKGN